ncbi:MAG: glutamyl-tRNA reductase, partial [Chloroflexi bacterium]|nr:glutamyl-tRNA reductase [Chloroflexota bacterium]
ALARSAPIRVAGFEQLGEILTQVDLVIASTSATRPIIRLEEVQRALSARTDRKLMLIDLALPRNIDPALREFPGVSLWSIDDLSQRIEANLRVRAREIPKVEAILAQETTAFMEWYRSRQAILTITQLREHARAIQKSELTRALRRLGQLSDREIRIVEGLAESIVNKLLHQPTVRLKKEACRGNGALYTDALQTLFGLDPGEGHPDD